MTHQKFQVPKMEGLLNLIFGYFGENQVPQVFGEMTHQELGRIIWAIYNDLSRGHPKWWFSKGIPPKMALN